MRYLHTMLRVRDLDAALDFYCNKLGLRESFRREDPNGRYTLVFLMAPGDHALIEQSKRLGRPGPLLELTYNWDTEDYGEARHFGHLAFEVDNIYDGQMAFIRSPDRQSIELLQKGNALPPKEPWASMPNTGHW
jgi:lactoylglutathione lyase